MFLPAIAGESPLPVAPAAVQIPDGHGELLLLVDDDAPLRDIVSATLEQHGYRVLSCGSGVEAIALFCARPEEISLVITDVEMPRMGGGDLARTLLQLRPGIRLLAVSGLSPGDTDNPELAAIHKLVHAFLLKPFTSENLLGAVHRLLSSPKGP